MAVPFWAFPVGAAAIGALARLIFPTNPFTPEPQNPPYYLPEQDTPPLGGQCPRPYGLVLIVSYQGLSDQRFCVFGGGCSGTLSDARTAMFDAGRQFTFTAPIRAVSRQITGTNAITITVQDQGATAKTYVLARYFAIVGANEVNAVSYEWIPATGTDDCGTTPPNPERPYAPQPRLPPSGSSGDPAQVAPPRNPAPPPAFPLPPIAVFAPTVNFNPQIDINLNFETTLNAEVDITFEYNDPDNPDKPTGGTGSIQIPKTDLAEVYKLLRLITENQRVAARRLEYLKDRVDCIHEEICEDKRSYFYRRLGDVSFGAVNLFGFLRLSENYRLEYATISLQTAPRTLGKRIRNRLPFLFSNPALGFVAIQRTDLSFSEPIPWRYPRQSFLLSQNDAAIVVYPEPNVTAQVFVQLSQPTS